MRRDERSAGAEEVLGARALREWVTGEQDEYARVFLVEDGAPLDGVDEVAGDDDAILLPVASGPYEGPASAVRYSGSLRAIGDEIYLGERGVELQDYIAAGFVQILGPTVVSLVDGSGWRAFLDDAELARRTGVFPSALIDPRVLLADRSALARPHEVDTANAIGVDADGMIRVGMHGDRLGSISELPALLAEPRPRSARLAGIASRDALAAGLRGRGWIERYLSATDLLKMLRVGNGVVKISGFGWSLIDDELADAEPLNDDPFLLESAEGLMLADTTTLRRHLLSPVAAGVVAATQTSSTLDVATERVARQLGVSVTEASLLCREAVIELGIHVGGRAEVACSSEGSAR